MSRDPYPTSFLVTAWLAVLNVALSVGIALLTWARHDALLVAWAERNRAAGRIYADEGLEGLRNSNVVPEFVPLAIVSVAVFAPMVTVCLLFLRERVSWARPLLSVTLFFAGLLAVAGMSRNVPATFTVLSVAVLATLAALLVSLWWPTTTAWLRKADQLPGDLLAPEQVAPEVA